MGAEGSRQTHGLESKRVRTVSETTEEVWFDHWGESVANQMCYLSTSPLTSPVVLF